MILVNRGIFATPTIIINDRLVYMTNSYEELSRLLEYELQVKTEEPITDYEEIYMFSFSYKNRNLFLLFFLPVL